MDIYKKQELYNKFIDSKKMPDNKEEQLAILEVQNQIRHGEFIVRKEHIVQEFARLLELY